MLKPKITKICITGGPSGGKTTLIQALKKELGHKVTLVPETASILYSGGFPRGKSERAFFHTQRAIFFTQKELEDLIQEEAKSNIIVCDRGSLDGIAYWPWDESHFFEALHTDRGQELKRYDWVLHLDTADHDFYDSSNPIRTESHEEALQLNQKVHFAWRDHPQRIVISSKFDFLSKMKKAISVIEMILAGRSFQEVNDQIHLIPSERLS
jgi:nicotinamide riboside kinase